MTSPMTGIIVTMCWIFSPNFIKRILLCISSLKDGKYFTENINNFPNKLKKKKATGGQTLIPKPCSSEMVLSHSPREQGADKPF